MNKVQQEKIATSEECNRRRMQIGNIAQVKVQHEIVQYIKRAQHEEKCNMKRSLHKKVQYGKSVV